MRVLQYEPRTVMLYEPGIVYVRLRRGYWARSTFPRPLLVLDWREDGRLLGFELTLRSWPRRAAVATITCGKTVYNEKEGL